MIRLDNVTKKFGDLVAVDQLSVDIPKGEFFVVLGPNAAGKTTTIKMMVGLLKPTDGQVFLGGMNIQEKPVEAKRILSYVPDFPFLYEKLTPREFFDFVGDLFEMPRSEVQQDTTHLIDYLNLGEYRDSLIEHLSHGTRQRVAIAAALLHRPEVFIIDEPMVGLDPKHAKLVKDILKQRSREGMTVFLSSHQLNLAEELADRVGIIHKGKLIACAHPTDMRNPDGSHHQQALEEIFLKLTEEEPEADPGKSPEF
ncbi:MAG: ABC transporter ATP-binding protein [Verrucomicrobiota bacterium]|nr:ABC transporter ATP-binding protein [Verrucomicrobiota bacterium]